ncbi:acetylcholine receptor subunit beta-like 1 [Mercenaria mercenaria]|uniref:acetylcholine receptor subunit beta-like 1 n=1 Tax=Mercenaria mercenaria TaxID=6596 RepID=UPI00234EA02E|nr:acetylcholine receptor subunit beta-like 1 [Mercenaria mercenaria]
MLLFSRMIILFIAVLPVQSGSWNDSNTLMADLMCGYNHRLRPINNQSKPIRVNFSFDLMTIQDFNEVEGKLSVVGFMYLGWFDERLIWESSKYGDTDSLMIPLTEVWHPTIVLSNSFDQIDDIGDDWMTVEYRPDGRAFYVPGDVFAASCSADVTFYPFDYQVCYIFFVSWGFTSGKLSLNLWPHTVFKSYFTENGEWLLVKAIPLRFPGGHQDEVDAVAIELTIKRRSTFLVVNVILPVVFMSLINILVFMLPAESGERVSYAITVLLSLAVFLTLVVNNLPKTSQPMAILCYYLMFTLVTSVCMCVVTIFNLRLFYMKSDIAVPECCKLIVRVMCTCRRTTSITTEDNRFNNEGTNSDKNGNEPNPPITHSENVRHIRKPFLDERINNKKNENNAGDISWRDVSGVLDRVFFVAFLATLIVINGIFLSVMSKNKRHE